MRGATGSVCAASAMGLGYPAGGSGPRRAALLRLAADEFDPAFAELDGAAEDFLRVGVVPEQVEGAVDLLPDAPVLSVNQIIYLRPTRQSDILQVAQHVILVSRDLSANCLAHKLAVCGVGIRGRAIRFRRAGCGTSRFRCPIRRRDL